MRAGRRMAAGWIGGIMLMLAALPALAAEALEIHLETYRSQDGNLMVYANDNLGRDTAPLPENYQVSLGGEDLPVTDVRRFGDTGESTAWIFLVDVSGSISSAKLEQLKSYLELVASQLQDQDRVCIATLGDTMAAGDFISGKDAVRAKIGEIERLREDTNLYYGIVEALKLLDTYDTGTVKKALLIVSDGEDDQAAGITRDEVEKQIDKTRIPIYTAAVTNAGAGSRNVEFAKVLGSFARLSAGGFHTAFGVDDISMEDSAAQVAESMQKSLVITADASGYKTSVGQAYLKVTVNVPEQGSASDGRQIADGDIGPIPETDAEETQAASQEDTSQPPAPLDGKKKQLAVMIAASAAVLTAIAAAAILAGKKKKRRLQEEEAARLAMENAAAAPLEPDTGEPAISAGLMEADRDMAETAPRREEPRRPGRRVYLTRLGMDETTYELNVQDRVTIGRSPERSDYAFPDDTCLSGAHCALIAYDQDLVLCDLDSMNGTQVNGIPITQPYPLKCDDVIRIGQSEYRIHWQI